MTQQHLSASQTGTALDDPDGSGDPQADVLLQELVAARAAGDERLITRAETAVITHHLPRARRIARRYSGRGASMDDLEQQARLGLVQAVRRWQPGRAPSFMAFAAPTMDGSIKRWFRDSLTTIRRPRSLQEAAPVIRTAREELAHTTGREPSAQELADITGMPLSEIREWQRSAVICNPGSLDGVPDPDGVAPVRDDGLDRVELRRDLAGAWARLTVRERKVIALHYWDDMSQAAIGEVIGVSQMQVSRILSKAISTLSTEVTAEVPAA
ncbi:sigma-70 family RNA polymerase sigma factor [Nakamurella alba]|uniref:sigma-70 family RNA polymerase sigma factor n=1 Tax=Nakamurella alba TaxID=2665158 RepID=UPI0018AA16C1|nr:sigma-70 family RNA polymerase sigma factor [Nakamurella alba]